MCFVYLLSVCIHISLTTLSKNTAFSNLRAKAERWLQEQEQWEFSLATPQRHFGSHQSGDTPPSHPTPNVFDVSCKVANDTTICETGLLDGELCVVSYRTVFIYWKLHWVDKLH